MPTTAKWTMSPERFAVVFRIVCGLDRRRYFGACADVRFALEHKAEFKSAATPAGFAERNMIEVTG